MSANIGLPLPGTDRSGARLPIEIRIDRRGRVYFHDLPPDALGLAQALDPENAEMRQRVALAEAFLDGDSGTTPVRTA
ncbi:MAG: hypothetical protein ACT4PL_04895 [Phycisphaerales bacterium]